MEEPKWRYEKLNEKGQVQWAPQNDADGKITGKYIFNLPAWFDENPEERKRLGYIKHIMHSPKDIEYDRATQYLVNSVKTIDEYTVEDDYKILDMSEEQMRLAELRPEDDWWHYDDTVITWR